MRFAAILLLICFRLAHAQEWRYYGGDAGGTKYSPLAQINRLNVASLKPAWTFHTGEISDGRTLLTRTSFEGTPLIVDGVMYLTTPYARLIALDPETGTQKWAFDPKLDKTRPANLYINRGSAFWSDGRRKRIFYGTLDARLFSIDATTGEPDPAFGGTGHVDLRTGMADQFPGRGYGMTSPPAIYKNLVICGALAFDGEPKGPSGDVRAFDTRTGKLVWRFHVVPRAGEFGNNTWEGDSWKDRGGTNAWSILSVDHQRGIVYLPLTSPSTDLYGGDRKGANLFGNSLVALEAATGKRIWHFQTIHHDIWDYDLPAQPVLATVTRAGKPVPAVAQITKTGFVFLFDRASGKPLFDIEERPVAPSEVPGEQAWPTQPFPVKPPPFTRQSLQPGELNDLTPELKEFCGKLVEGASFGKLFTPIGLKPTVLFPSTNGGANWGGASFDPQSQTLYVNSMEIGFIQQMVKRPEAQDGIPYRARGKPTPNSRFWNSRLIPCQKPPWGYLTAIDMNSGEFRWRSVLGVVDELTGRGIPPTGTANLGGSIVTAGGLVFIGATNDGRFRAFDKETGEELWTTKLSASAHATPATYLGAKTKKQFVVVAAGGGNKYSEGYADELVAFTLP
jgi:quinoprotein glucose dehydrogenase